MTNERAKAEEQLSRRPARLLMDVANVLGSRPTGWWRDWVVLPPSSSIDRPPLQSFPARARAVRAPNPRTERRVNPRRNKRGTAPLAPRDGVRDCSRE